VLAGTVQPRHERFFATEIAPHIDGTRMRFVGEVGGAQAETVRGRVRVSDADPLA
jgi:hypothetical protein